MEEATLVRMKIQAAELRLMAARTRESDRERKLLMLAEGLEDDVARLEEALSRSR
jgi:hypothetical protein